MYRSIALVRPFLNKILSIILCLTFCGLGLGEDETDKRIGEFLKQSAEILDGLKYEFALESVTESPAFGIGGRRVFGRQIFWNRGSNVRLDAVSLKLQDESIRPSSVRESSLILDTVAYRFYHSSRLPIEKSEVRAGVRKLRRGTEMPDPFTLSTCSATVSSTPQAKPMFLIDYTTVNEGETEDGRFASWLLFSDNLSCARVVFAKEVPWAPEIVELRFNKDRGSEQRKRKHTFTDLKTWQAQKDVVTKWEEFEPGKYVPTRIRQSVDNINGKTVVEIRFKNYTGLDKSDKSLISEEAFTVKNIIGAIDFQSIFESFDVGLHQ
jgi:hypothetical protein